MKINQAMKQHSESSCSQGTLIFSVPVPLWQLDGKREHDLRRQRTKKWACAKRPATTHPIGTKLPEHVNKVLRVRMIQVRSSRFETYPCCRHNSSQCCQVCVSTACALRIPQQLSIAAAPPGKDPCDTPEGIRHSSTFSDHANVVNSYETLPIFQIVFPKSDSIAVASEAGIPKKYPKSHSVFPSHTARASRTARRRCHRCWGASVRAPMVCL